MEDYMRKNVVIVVVVLLYCTWIFNSVYASTICIVDYNNNINLSKASSFIDATNMLTHSLVLDDGSLASFIITRVIWLIAIFVFSILSVIVFRGIITFVYNVFIGTSNYFKSLKKSKEINKILIGINR